MRYAEALEQRQLIVDARVLTALSQLVISQEITRCAARGYGDGLNAGCVIGLPPVLNFGSPELKARVVPDVLGGKKFICLAVSE